MSLKQSQVPTPPPLSLPLFILSPLSFHLPCSCCCSWQPLAVLIKFCAPKISFYCGLLPTFLERLLHNLPDLPTPPYHPSPHCLQVFYALDSGWNFINLQNKNWMCALHLKCKIKNARAAWAELTGGEKRGERWGLTGESIKWMSKSTHNGSSWLNNSFDKHTHTHRGRQIWAAAVRLLTMSLATIYGVVSGSGSISCLPACLLLQLLLLLLLPALLLLSLWQSPLVASALCVIVSMEMNINAVWIVQSTYTPLSLPMSTPTTPFAIPGACLSSSRRHRPVWQSPLPAAAQCALCSALIFISGITSCFSCCCCCSSCCCCCYSICCCCCYYCCCCRWRFPWLSNMFSIVFVCFLRSLYHISIKKCLIEQKKIRGKSWKSLWKCQ